ncbi:MAG: hypothetical protein HKN87_01455 [Saprospiraceae bacterium]|nr:hypothetical protein [Saprospiraceae bacterium]
MIIAHRLSALLIWLVCSSQLVHSQGSWALELPTVGTFSSPRVSDLTGDGVADIVLGAGREEFQSCDSAVVAIDGVSGELLWCVSAKDQIFGSAMFLDITNDGVQDVFICGRSAELLAINGRSGKVLWRFTQVHQLRRPTKSGWFNFYNPQFVADQDGDGLHDLLVSNGGDVMAEPYDPNRPPGQLVLISSMTGEIIHQAKMPDGKEIYMSITVSPQQDDVPASVIFGTGGETIGGNLFNIALHDVFQNDLSSAVRLDSSEDKGFIGPSIRADLNKDGISDVVTNSVDGRLLAFDGSTHAKLWDVTLPMTESYSSPAVGYFTEDEVPDFFISYGKGVWPHLGWGIQKLVDGRTGQVLFTDSLGFYQNTSPLAVDLNQDGRDEAILSVNFQEIDELYRKFFYTMLVYIDFATGDIQQISEVFPGNNLSSTPWLGDLDADGMLDVIYCHGTNNRQTYTFDGMKVRRIVTQIPVPRKLSWGAYQGNDYDGNFKRSRKIP